MVQLIRGNTNGASVPPTRWPAVEDQIKQILLKGACYPLFQRRSAPSASI